MVFDAAAIDALRGYLDERRASLAVEDVEASIAESIASSGAIAESAGHTVWAPDDPERLTTEQAAELLGVTTRAVCALCDRGRLRTARAPRRTGERLDLTIETRSLAELVYARTRGNSRA